jgi:hypothetical protein
MLHTGGVRPPEDLVTVVIELAGTQMTVRVNEHAKRVTLWE